MLRSSILNIGLDVLGLKSMDIYRLSKYPAEAGLIIFAFSYSTK